MELSRDAFLVLVACVTLILAFLWAGLVEWAAFLTAFTILLGIAEFIVMRVTGKTLSARFGEFRARRPLVANLLLLLLLAAMVGLVLHLIAMTPDSVTEPTIVGDV